MRIVQVDRYRRVLVIDGERWFAMGVFGIFPEYLHEASEPGFNVTLRWKGVTTLDRYQRTKAWDVAMRDFHIDRDEHMSEVKSQDPEFEPNEANLIVNSSFESDYGRLPGWPYAWHPGSTIYREDIRERNEIFVPAGSGRTSCIDIRDIAEAAATVMAEDGHFGKAYILTGSEALTYTDVAQILSETLDRNIRYANPSAREFLHRLDAQGVEKSFARVMSRIYTIARWGLAAQVAPDLQQLIGRPPITVRPGRIGNPSHILLQLQSGFSC